MENKELEKWLEETKAKNLSQWELQNEIDLIMDKGFLMQLKGSNNYTKASILFNQWQKEAEFSPKRGDRVLVWDGNEEVYERIFIAEIKGCINPILVVHYEYEKEFKNNEWFKITEFEHMKPLPTEQPKETIEEASEIYAEQNAKDPNISYHNLFSPLKYAFIDGAKWQSEQPKETDFKSQVIKLIEKNINDKQQKLEFVIDKNNLIYEAVLECIVAIQKDLLNKIKQLT